jgi:hypothetical protein
MQVARVRFGGRTSRFRARATVHTVHEGRRLARRATKQEPFHRESLGSQSFRARIRPQRDVTTHDTWPSFDKRCALATSTVGRAALIRPSAR